MCESDYCPASAHFTGNDQTHAITSPPPHPLFFFIFFMIRYYENGRRLANIGSKVYIPSAGSGSSEEQIGHSWRGKGARRRY